jgi:hypothetical protein
MKLYQIQTAQIGSRVDGIQILVDKQSDCLNERRQPVDYSGGLLRKNMARGFVEENETESIRPGIDCKLGVFKIGYAADFDFDH